jgi:hypothetical protein
MNTYAYIGLSAALMTASAGIGAGSVVYMRPLQPPQQQAVAVPQSLPLPPAPAIRTASWFEAHDTDRKAKMVACHDNPGVARLGDPECDNAFNARDNIAYRKFHEEAWRH